LTDEYIQQETGVFLRRSSIPDLKKTDSVILDIDGVILDVAASFRVAISQTTQFYFTRILRWNGKAILVSPAETQSFKLAGGFNNDWELTYAAVLFFLAKSVQFDNNNLDFLKNRGKSVKDFTKEVATQGGGLKSAEKVIFLSVKQAQADRIAGLWDRAKIKRIFQELYAGTDYCKKLYGFEPQFVQEKGLINQEKVLLDAANLKAFYPKIGVLTGRTSEEADVALDFAALRGMISEDAIFCDDGGLTKPDPKILLDLGRILDTRVGIYLGDTVDDFRTVANFQDAQSNEQSSTRFLSAIITHKESERDIYFGLRADIVAEDPNKVLAAVSELKQG